MKLVAKENYSYFNGEVYSKDVDLGVNDKPENWQLIKDENIVKESEAE